MFYGYEYFSGANVVVKTNGHACLEAAAISYNYMDSKQPIYGYCSQTFDAVAPGQKLIQGSLVINYVYDNYLFDCIKKGWISSNSAMYMAPMAQRSADSVGTAQGGNNTVAAPGGESEGQTLDQLVGQHTSPIEDSTYLGEEAEVVVPTAQSRAALQAEINRRTRELWTSNSTNEEIAYAAGTGSSVIPAEGQAVFVDPLGLGGGVNITIRYGERGEYLVLDSVHFVGRACAIQIDENVIVEEYSFFARSLRGSPVML